jgi:copper(I)-binding protein
MVFGLSPEAASGASLEITLTFADGDKLSSLLTVEKAGAAR